MNSLLVRLIVAVLFVVFAVLICGEFHLNILRISIGHVLMQVTTVFA